MKNFKALFAGIALSSMGINAAEAQSSHSYLADPESLRAVSAVFVDRINKCGQAGLMESAKAIFEAHCKPDNDCYSGEKADLNAANVLIRTAKLIEAGEAYNLDDVIDKLIYDITDVRPSICRATLAAKRAHEELGIPYPPLQPRP